ncbi:hypothetical protein HanXRQr2_Chr03g0124041 [Helianthus annuus]|uniref:Uncharacterized protein n=1 Tax=Helianthus annuus TaxID=4232 RepID=A0A9K3NWY3_HELAN|nr:hypothetical protein HanXRQr2_Chr03g0124041 [Helianthus annuus]
MKRLRLRVIRSGGDLVYQSLSFRNQNFIFVISLLVIILIVFFLIILILVVFLVVFGRRSGLRRWQRWRRSSSFRLEIAGNGFHNRFRV